MNIKLINEPDFQKTALQQILFNRGIQNIEQFLSPNINVINQPEDLGQKYILEGLSIILKTMQSKNKTAIVVDCDVDGFTSAALLSNYLHRLFPSYVENNISYFFHQGKSHGLSEFYETLMDSDFKLVITPDSSSNDYREHQKLSKNGVSILILDHHLAPKRSEYAITINNQLSDYPNKFLSGVGVVWQFCRAFDSVMRTDYANDFLDLVALGLTGDMMSLRSPQTSALIRAGFNEDRIKNGFIKEMIRKNYFSLTKPEYKSFIPGQAITPIGATFFIVPFVNAANRSGTQEEKRLIFEAMLEWQGGIKIPSTKRGHALGDKQTKIQQATRIITNVKNRQTNAEDSAMQKIIKKIQEENLDNHQVIVIEATDAEVKPEIRGLVANKIMAAYQKPVCVVSQVTNEDGEKVLSGSMRGYTKTGIDNFKEICEQTTAITFVQGHENAAGIGIKTEEKETFLKQVDEKISKITSSAGKVYRVDYIFNENDLRQDIIIDIATMNDYWGQDVDRAYIAVRMKITPYNFTVMKSNTLKINLSCDINAIKFKGTDEEIEKLTINQGYIDIMAYCKCNLNEWAGKTSGQLIIQDYEILDTYEYDF